MNIQKSGETFNFFVVSSNVKRFIPKSVCSLDLAWLADREVALLTAMKLPGRYTAETKVMILTVALSSTVSCVRFFSPSVRSRSSFSTFADSN